jgi:ribonuclease BN (tRNA processing enzyme)
VPTLTTLGSCGAWPEAGRSASGFLLAADGIRVVLDLGYATLPRLLTHCPDGTVDAVVITHEHPDHCADLSALCRVRTFGPARGGPRIPLYCPPGVLTRVQAMEPTEPLADVFAAHPLPGPYRLGPFALTSAALPHHVPHAGVRVSAPGFTLAYSGDAGPSPALTELAAGADLFIAGTTFHGPDAAPDPDLLTPAQAARAAADAGAARLLLTHFWPGTDRARAVSEARAAFGGEVLAADEDLVLDL